MGKSIVGFTPEAMQVLMNYNYPGNIRELRNIVEYAANVSTRKKVSTNSLPPYIFEQQTTDAEPVQQSAAAKRVGSQAAAIDGNEEKPQESWEEIERNMIVEALKEHGGSRTKCSESLGWGRMKLWRKMKHYNLL